MQEKRTHVRLTATPEHPIEVQIIGSNFFEVVRLQGRDISTGGLSLRVDHRFQGCAINQEVELIITLPNDIPFKARAVVRHKHANDSYSGYFGLYFTDISSHDRKEIEKYITEILRAEGGEAPT